MYTQRTSILKQGRIICTYKVNIAKRCLMSLGQGFAVSELVSIVLMCVGFQLELESMALCGKSFQICSTQMIYQSWQ